MAELRRTDSGIEIKPLYTDEDLADFDVTSGSERRERRRTPGASIRRCTAAVSGPCVSTRGSATPRPTNERFKFLLDAGQTGLSCAFDLPTQMGYDSDHPRAEGEVGKVGVAIDSIADMRLLLADIPLDDVTTSMTINSTAAILLLMYEIVAEEQGVDPSQISGTIQNDILKEYIARGTYVYPPRPSMRIITDIFEYCAKHIPRWNTISISGYHIREAGLDRSRRRSRSRSRTRSPTSRRRSMPASTSTTSGLGCRSSGTATTTSSKRWPSSGRVGGCGTRS